MAKHLANCAWIWPGGFIQFIWLALWNHCTLRRRVLDESNKQLLCPQLYLTPFVFFVFFFLFWCFCWILIETEKESDREGERACVRVLTAIKAIRCSWYKYLTLRGNLQHVMSRPWLGWTVTPSHITWFHVEEWRGGGHVSGLHRLHIRGWTMLPLTLISIKPFLWNSVPHRSQFPTCLFALSGWCRILAAHAEQAASENTQSGLFKVCWRAYICLFACPSAWHQTS